MIGTRLPDTTMDAPGGAWDNWESFESGVREIVAPLGAYMKVEKDGQLWAWYIRDPNGDASSIHSENHSVEEHPDGTITVSPSIVVTHGSGYHGFLQGGVWS